MRGIKNIRLKDYDYSNNGFYFVTICTNYHQPYLTNKQDIIQQGITSLAQIPGVLIDYWVAMPDHVHMIVILENSSSTLGEIVRRFKAYISRKAKIKVWQPNYYEHVIRSEHALYKIREYIQNNPEKILSDFNQFYDK